MDILFQNKKISDKLSFDNSLRNFRLKIIFAMTGGVLLFTVIMCGIIKFANGGAMLLLGIILALIVGTSLCLFVKHIFAEIFVVYNNHNKTKLDELRRIKHEHKSKTELLFVRDKQLSEMNARLMRSSQDLETGTKMLIKKDRELVLANQKLIHVDEIKSDFITTIAHQLRTPLSGIKWILSMLSKGEFGAVSDDGKKYLLKAYDSNNRMILLVNELLEIDRLENDKINYVFTETDLFRIIDTLIAEFSVEIKLRGIEIIVRGGENPFKVIADEQGIRSVAQNLLDNAIKYTVDAGTILITIQKDENFAKFSIKDSGIGIPSEAFEKIFTLFYRAPNATQAIADGSGAGLYLSKKIINKHGGKIWFESEEGKGSTFYFTIPLNLKTTNIRPMV